MSNKITLLVHDVHSPTMGAAVRIAHMLEGDYETEIIGPDLGHGVCSMYRHEPGIRAVFCKRIYRLPEFFFDCQRLEQAISGNVIIALKAYADTLPVALRVGRRRAIPVISYLDEWDGALWAGWPSMKKARAVVTRWHHPLEEMYTPWVERRLQHADAVVCSSSFLARRFHGQVIPMGVDTNFFKLVDDDRIRLRKKDLGLEGKKVVVFGGVVRPHKGLEILLEGMALLRDPELKLLVVGPMTDTLGHLMDSSVFKDMIHVAGDSRRGEGLAHQHMPEYLSVGDVLAVPLANSLLARSQVPIKLFEAMAMGRPVIGNAVSDVPALLDGCGWVIPPAQPKAWADTLRDVLTHPADAHKRSFASREKCVREFSLSTARAQWLALVNCVREKYERTLV